MSGAILIIGGSSKFKRSADIFSNFLQHRVGISNIVSIETAYLGSEDFKARFRKELDKTILLATQQPTLIDYIGHGWPGQWTINEDTGISYDFVAQALARVTKEVLLINDCCHAFSIKPFLEKFKVSEKLVGLIAACQNGQESDIGDIILSRQIEVAWTKREKIQARVKKIGELCKNCMTRNTRPKLEDWFIQDVRRWGRYLDPNFFPKHPELLSRNTTPL